MISHTTAVDRAGIRGKNEKTYLVTNFPVEQTEEQESERASGRVSAPRAPDSCRHEKERGRHAGRGGLSWRGSFRRETASRSEWQIATWKGNKERQEKAIAAIIGARARPTTYNQLVTIQYGEGGRGRRRQLDDSQKALARSAEMRLSVGRAIGRAIDRSVRPFC